MKILTKTFLLFSLIFSLTGCQYIAEPEIKIENTLPPEEEITVEEVEPDDGLEIVTRKEEIKKDEMVLANVDIIYPLIKEEIGETKYEAINSVIVSAIGADEASFRDFINISDLGMMPGPYAYENKCEKIRYDEDFLSVLCRVYHYTGGAHPNTHFITFNFDLETQEEITITDILQEGGFREISNISIESLSQNIEPELDYWIDQGAAPTNQNYQSFTISEEELTIYFDPYQVAPYAVGSQTVVIPFDELTEVINLD
ncbi:DUF3298 domain-containing protein [Pseudomonadota bacterium]